MSLFHSAWQLNLEYISICVYTYVVWYEMRCWGGEVFGWAKGRTALRGGGFFGCVGRGIFLLISPNQRRIPPKADLRY